MADQAAAQTSINDSASIIRAQDTVIGSAVLAFATMRHAYDSAIAKLAGSGVDTSVLEAASAEAKAATATLAAAIAANTIASDEVHTDQGGTGTAETAVDPAAVDTTVVTNPAPSGDDDTAAKPAGDDVPQG